MSLSRIRELEDAHVVALTDAANVATDSSIGGIFDITLGGNRTFTDPAGGYDGQKIIYRIRQDATGGRTITWGAVFRFSTDLPQPVLSTVGNALDYIGFVKNNANSTWDCIACVKGF